MDSGVTEDVMNFSHADIVKNEHSSPISSMADRSGSLLWKDQLHLLHSISQGLSDEIGSYWQGVMHCREKNFDNHLG